MSTNSASVCLSLFAKGEDRDGENRLSTLSRQAPNLAHNSMDRRVTEAAQNKTAESKARKRPNLPCAWHFALYRFANGSRNST
jgi:hypothetical protein